jgi:hypothetical protein
MSEDGAMITRRWHIAGSVLVLGLQLGGCGLTNDAPKPETSNPVVAKPVEKVGEPAKSQRHPPSAPKPPKAPSPDELIGLDESGVHKLLGSPAEMRNDNAARILSYRSVGCALDVILFMDLKAGDLRVLSYQWTGDGSRPHEASRCYAELHVTP